MNKEIRKLTRVGKRSVCVVVPARFVKKLKWKERQKVVLTLRGNRISIKDYESKK